MLWISCTKLKFGMVSHVLDMKTLYGLIQITSCCSQEFIDLTSVCHFYCVHLYKFLNYESKAKSRMDEWREKKLAK